MSPRGDFASAARDDVEAVAHRCAELVDALASQHPGMRDAIRHSLLGGGKRLRAVLCLWAHDFVGGNARAAAIEAACAIECVHAYSLVHDDLPCMDDDDLRRGQPSCHARFGEATAVLAGDALLNLAFEVMATIPARHPGVSAVTSLDALAELASASGSGGLITGQALDLESEGVLGGTVEAVDRIHAMKTGRLIAAAMVVGAIFGGARTEACERVRAAGLLAGRAFQIVDDILDLEVDEETLGKTPGKDVKKKKLTYPSVVGIDAAREQARALAEGAKELLAGVGGGTQRLGMAIDFIVERVA